MSDARQEWSRIAVLAGLATYALGCVASVQPERPHATPESMAELCAGIPEAERERPSFMQPSGIAGIRPLMGEFHYIKFSEPELRGAEIAAAASPGATKQWIARVARCHVAWADAMGVAHEPYEDPLMVGQPDISVSETETGFVVRVAGKNKAQGEEILRRAQLLTESPRADAAHE